MTGEAADGSITIEFTSTPSWTWILLLFGILPFLIARAFSKTRVRGIIPMSDAALRRARTFNRICIGILCVTALVLLTGFLGRPHLLMAGLVMLIGALVFIAVGWWSVYPTGQVSGEWVWLSSVAPRFAEELGRFYGVQGRHP